MTTPVRDALPDGAPALTGDVLAIRGGRPLRGRVDVKGAKDLATKAMVATLLGDTASTLRDVPDLSDVAVVRSLLEVHGASPCRVALFACTDTQPDFAAAGQHPGTHYLQVSLQADTLARVTDAIARARAAGADWVVFSNHWGANFVERPAPEIGSRERRADQHRPFEHDPLEIGADQIGLWERGLGGVGAAQPGAAEIRRRRRELTFFRRRCSP